VDFVSIGEETWWRCEKMCELPVDWSWCWSCMAKIWLYWDQVQRLV